MVGGEEKVQVRSERVVVNEPMLLTATICRVLCKTKIAFAFPDVESPRPYQVMLCKVAPSASAGEVNKLPHITLALGVVKLLPVLEPKLEEPPPVFPSVILS